MPTTPPLPIAGFVPLSTCDWEGKFVSTIFTQGCPMACVFCHNPSLIPTRTNTTVTWEDVRTHLEKRQGLLDGLVFSGGEPTMHLALVEKALEVKSMGYQVGVHTAGSYPARIAQLVDKNAVDWVGFDLKGGWERYQHITASGVTKDKVLRTMDTLLTAGVDVEFRTTLHPDFFTEQDAHDISAVLEDHEQTTWVLQPARSVENGASFSDVPEKWLKRITSIAFDHNVNARIR